MNILNWRLRTRMGTGFALLLLLLLLVSIISAVALAELRRTSNLIIDEYYPTTVLANNIIDGANKNYLLTFRAVVAHNERERNKYIDELNGQTALNVSHMEELKRRIAGNTQAEKMVDEMEDAAREVTASMQHVFAVQKSDGADAAEALLNTETIPATDNFIKQITDIIMYTDELVTAGDDEVESTYRSSLWMTGIIVALSVFLGCIIAWALTRSVVRPVQEALAGIEASGRGDMTIPFRDEYHTDETGRLLTGLKATVISISRMLSQVRDSSLSVSTASSQIAAGNQNLSSRTEEQASALAETASALEQLTATVANTAENAQHVQQLVTESGNIMKRNNEVMDATTRQMDGIHQASQRMSEIITVIESIAFQTNILALNAAVEAARAGESGRGFAVVAGEVRSLAQKSATAAKDIKALIEESVNQTEAGRELIATASTVTREMTQNAQNVGTLINEIARAATEQSDGIRQINVAVMQLDTTTQQNAALVEESASTAQSMAEQAAMLTELVNTFRLREGLTAMATASHQVVPEVATLPTWR
ncbi:HAMP domain-containing protein [Salmonella enterica subsp. enterica serovar Newport]|uniref:Methyl-accepting chemotaxis sensory transducer n=1 Tax=Salmonella enterica subsp. salamae TaxID=59202 RepID=A0A5Y3MZ68_SALER|nr:HAMP domain-containing protein [Salmonella enterica subsp. enterica serovar Newport]ECI4011686.1 methyl-accepting chemotaxis sensory transducer [Salmonella enterica subsp. salamae]